MTKKNKINRGSSSGDFILRNISLALMGVQDRRSGSITEEYHTVVSRY